MVLAIKWIYDDFLERINDGKDGETCQCRWQQWWFMIEVDDNCVAEASFRAWWWLVMHWNFIGGGL